MNATTSRKLKKLERVLQIFAVAALLVWVGFLFCSGQYARGVDWLWPFLIVVGGFPLFDLAVAPGYLKLRSQDSWGYIIGVTVFVLFTAALVMTFLLCVLAR